MNEKYRSDAMAAIHETMAAVHDVAGIDEQTMRRFDDACLAPFRDKENVSQESNLGDPW